MNVRDAFPQMCACLLLAFSATAAGAELRAAAPAARDIETLRTGSHNPSPWGYRMFFVFGRVLLEEDRR